VRLRWYGIYSAGALTNSLNAWAQLIDTKEDQDHHRIVRLFTERERMSQCVLAFGFIKVQWSRADNAVNRSNNFSLCFGFGLEPHGKRERERGFHAGRLSESFLN
jgi:hypothetical protein